jgi:glycosyltransferase involved in cell wall biosynthesis
VNVGLVVPGYSADTTDWCIPALRHFTRSLDTERPRVFALRYPHRQARYPLENAEVIALGGAERRGPSVATVWQRTFAALAAEHRRSRFDLLHAFWATESGLLAALAGRVLGIPVLVSLAGGELVALRDIGYGDQRRPWERLKIATALRLASAVSAGSHYLVRLAQPRLARPVEWLPLGVDTRMFQPEARREQHRVLHVGTLTAVKDQRALLAAFAHARRRLPRLTLRVIGEGPLRGELLRLASQLHLDGAVCLAGARDHGELAAEYQAASAFVLSSRHEAQGMVALEAASCGVPVVGTRVGNVPEIAPDSCVDVGDVRALGEAIEHQCAAGGDADAAAQRHLVEHTFSLEASVRRFRACYARLAA